MRCENCNTENPDAAKFCIECGHALARRCPHCGTSNPAAARFCAECGSNLAPSTAAAPTPPHPPVKTPSRDRAAVSDAANVIRVAADAAAPAADGERKTVTALFADIKGSTELMEDLDPEEARALVDPALQLMIAAVHHYDGYIVQSTGDGIFALFGAPIAHEEHPQRALYAALRMQEGILSYAARLRADGRPPIEVRVGINTGEVVVRSIRTGQHSTEYTPIGHTTNLASRLQTIAPTGAVVLSAATARLVAGYFELKSLGPVRLRGISEAVVAYEVVGLGPLRTRLEASALRGFSKFVGRAAELEQMRAALARAVEGRGQAVAVTGEAGVGKSRLFHEFKAMARPECRILKTFAVSHGKNSPWLPVISLLNDYFAIANADDARARREKVTGKVLTLERTLDDTLPYLFALLGIQDGADPLAEDDAQVRRRLTLAAIVRIVLCESRVRPLILIFEDLHWIDSSTQVLLDLMVQDFAAARVLVLVNYRPEYRHGWGELPCYTEIPLRPLGLESADEMLDAILGDISAAAPQLAGLKRLIIDRTAGNPFFIEEMVHALFEQQILVRNGAVKLARPLDEVRIPPTVEGILASRIDRLPPAGKELLQTLAVIGREFPLSLVRHVVPLIRVEAEARDTGAGDGIERRLADLRAADFIYEEPAWPDTRYVFKHALTQEVAYNSVLNERRKLLHERTAAGIEVIFHGRLDDHVADLAHHYGRSGNVRKAAEYLRLAAIQAAARQAYAEAVQHLTAALDLLATLPEGRERDSDEIELRTRLGRYLIPLRGPANDEVGVAFERARELCERIGDVENLFWVNYGIQFFRLLRLQLKSARELGERQLIFAERSADPAMKMAAYVPLANTLLFCGEFAAAAELCERGLKLPPDVRGSPLGDIGAPRPMILSLSASALGVLGYPARAMERSRESIAVAEPGPHSYALAINNAAQLSNRLRQPERALALADKLAALAERGFPVWAAQARSHRAEAYVELGRYDEAIAGLGEAALAYESSGAVGGFWRLHLAQAYARTGRITEGMEVLASLEETIESTGLTMTLSIFYRLKGEMLHMRGGPGDAAEAERFMRTAIDVARSQGARLFELRATVSLARLLDSSGRRGEARAMLTAIYHWFTEGFDTVDLIEARTLLDELSA